MVPERSNVNPKPAGEGSMVNSGILLDAEIRRTTGIMFESVLSGDPSVTEAEPYSCRYKVLGREEEQGCGHEDEVEQDQFQGHVPDVYRGRIVRCQFGKLSLAHYGAGSAPRGDEQHESDEEQGAPCGRGSVWHWEDQVAGDIKKM